VFIKILSPEKEKKASSSLSLQPKEEFAGFQRIRGGISTKLFRKSGELASTKIKFNRHVYNLQCQ
jgi:hypothetical protein